MELTIAKIYNADKSDLFWKSFEVSQKEKPVCIKFIPCSNSNGSNKLRIMVNDDY